MLLHSGLRPTFPTASPCRAPLQSLQSVSNGHNVKMEPAPPSSHTSSRANWHELSQLAALELMRSFTTT